MAFDLLTREFYLRDAEVVARELLGKKLTHMTGDGPISGVIVETEAYLGPGDAASHSYKGIRGSRTEIQYGEGGYAYIYLIYGMYHCLNVVAAPPEKPQVALIRALEPVEGLPVMRAGDRGKRREDDRRLCAGPGKLCRAMKIDKSHYGEDLRGDRLFIEDYKAVKAEEIAVTPRINIGYAGEAAGYPLRFYIKGNPSVSRP